MRKLRKFFSYVKQHQNSFGYGSAEVSTRRGGAEVSASAEVGAGRRVFVRGPAFGAVKVL